MSYSTYKRVKKLNTGGQIGATVGSTATSFIPGVGPALAPIGGMVGGAIGSGIESLLKKKERNVQSYASGYMRNGGELTAAVPMGGTAKKYQGKKHEQGGIPIDSQGNPTSRQNATAEVEGGETEQDGYIFSDSLKVPNTNKTFADVHEQFLKSGADPSRIEALKKLQERMRMRTGNRKWGNQATSIPKMENGGLPVQGALSVAYDYFANSQKEEAKPKKDLLGIAGYAVPSALRLGMAATSKKPEMANKIVAEKVPVTSPAFAGARSSLSAAFRANPNQASYAQFTRGINEVAGQEANYRNQTQLQNAEAQNRANIYNSRIEQQNIERMDQERGAKMSLIGQAIESPLTAALTDRRGKQQMIANVFASAHRVQDPVDRMKMVRAQLRGILSDMEIEKMFADYNFSAEASKEKSKS